MDVWGKQRELRFYLTDVPAKMRFQWMLCALSGLWLLVAGPISIVLVPDSKWAGLGWTISGIVGDPLLLAAVDMLFPYGTYKSLATQCLALMYGVLIMAFNLFYGPIGYAASMLVHDCSQMMIC
ncbi:unnamed protein product [Vitrella brassicaformis CCMP3155]|uniref:Uncharacterized protein n=1 Tax=Vitrella brassicaformis (strain CCMP3155) TaxID=1169540 RepID=A0A0G4EVA1_VITBC|nr:unnamed protein product [Vitrella brassicaformis CCMP3155]|eukprot:CEM01989.1 unnamed protein product [Vitrella brassicaformis CCMP3155]